MELNSKVELTDIAKKIIDERLTNKLVINYILFFIVVNWRFFLIMFSDLEIDKKISQIENLHNYSFYLWPFVFAIIATIILPALNILVTWYTEKMKVCAINAKKKQNFLILEEVSYTTIIKKRNEELELEIYKSSLLKNKAFDSVKSLYSDSLKVKKEQIVIDIISEGIEENSFVFYNTSEKRYNYLDGASESLFERGQMKDFYFVYSRNGNLRILIKSDEGVIKFKLNLAKVISPDNESRIKSLLKVDQNENFEAKWIK